MPDKLGKLSDNDRSKAREWLAKHAPEPCSGCGKHNFVTAGHVVALHAEVENFLKAHSYYPVIPIICGNCARVQLYAARLMGIDRDFSESDGEATDDR